MVEREGEIEEWGKRGNLIWWTYTPFFLGFFLSERGISLFFDIFHQKIFGLVLVDQIHRKGWIKFIIYQTFK